MLKFGKNQLQLPGGGNPATVVPLKLVAGTRALLFIEKPARNPLRWGVNLTESIKNKRKSKFFKKNQ